MNNIFKSTKKVKQSSKYTGRPAIYDFTELKIGESLRLDKNSAAHNT